MTNFCRSTYDAHYRQQEQRLAAERERLETTRLAAGHAAGLRDAYAAAKSAGALLTSELRMMIRSLVDLSAVSPVVEISWFQRGTEAERLVGADNAVASTRRRLIAAPAIVRREHVLWVLHEIGHCRAKTVQAKVRSEVDAWEWAIRHSISFEPGDIDTIHECLGSYLRSATELSAAYDVIHAERFLESLPERLKPLSPTAIAAFEEREFAAEHGRLLCSQVGCVRRAAVMVRGKASCVDCSLTIERKAGAARRRRKAVIERIESEMLVEAYRKTRRMSSALALIGDKQTRHRRHISSGGPCATKECRFRAVFDVDGTRLCHEHSLDAVMPGPREQRSLIETR